MYDDIEEHLPPPEVPDYIARAIEAQGKTSPEEVRARMDEPEEEEPIQPDEQLPFEDVRPIVWEEFCTPTEAAITKRVRRMQNQLGPAAREWIAKRLSATVGDGARSKKQFVNTARGKFRISLSADGDNTTETAAHERMGVRTVRIEAVEEAVAFFSEHGLPGEATYKELREHLLTTFQGGRDE